MTAFTDSLIEAYETEAVALLIKYTQMDEATARKVVMNLVLSAQMRTARELGRALDRREDSANSSHEP